MFPITSCTIDLTQACNLACPFCFCREHNNKRLNVKMGHKIINFFLNSAKESQENRMPSISWWGGEPLLEYKLMQKLTYYALDKGARLEIPRIQFGGTTNGTLLTPDKYEWLSQYKTMFLVSIDGRQRSHDLFRVYKNGRGSWLDVVNNLRYAVGKWPHLQVRMGPSVETIQWFSEDVKFLHEELRIKHISFSPVFEGNWTDEKLDIARKELGKAVEYYNIHRDLFVKHFTDYKYNRNQRKQLPCGAGIGYVGFGVDGSIFPCHRFNKHNDHRKWQDKEWCIGHVDHGITRPEVRDRFINWDKTPKPWCEGCPAFSPCFGACHATNVDLTGDMGKPPESMCKWYKILREISDLVIRENPNINDSRVFGRIKL